MISHVIFSSNPSLGYLWSYLVGMIYYYKLSKIDKVFDSIVKEERGHMTDRDVIINIAVVEDKAYWVVGSVFYEADIVDGEVDKHSSKPVNVFDMSTGDVRRMLFILDHLKEG